jgi:hypothetical protein
MDWNSVVPIVTIRCAIFVDRHFAAPTLIRVCVEIIYATPIQPLTISNQKSVATNLIATLS